MPREKNVNRKPVSYKKELSGSEKNRKRKKLEEENRKLTESFKKHFKTTLSETNETGKLISQGCYKTYNSITL